MFENYQECPRLNSTQLEILKFIPRKEWSCARAKITFDEVMHSTGAGEIDPAKGKFICGQTGDQLTTDDEMPLQVCSC